MKRTLDRVIFIFALPHEIFHYLAARCVGTRPVWGVGHITVNGHLSTFQVVFISLLPAVMDLIGLILWIIFYPHSPGLVNLRLFQLGLAYFIGGLIAAFDDYKIAIAAICLSKRKVER